MGHYIRNKEVLARACVEDSKKSTTLARPCVQNGR